MEKLQLLLEQELGRIIIAIVILVVLLVVVITIANVSSKRKKAKLDNTRTLHKAEFEKAAKKRMEMTQSISRDSLRKELEQDKVEKKHDQKELEQTYVPRSKSLDEKTQELNLDSVRRKLEQDRRAKENSEPVGVKLEDVTKASSEEVTKISSSEDLEVTSEPVVKEETAVIDPNQLVDELKTLDVPIEIKEETILTDSLEEKPQDNFDFDNTNVENVLFETEFSDVAVGSETLPVIDVWDEDFGVAEKEHVSPEDIDVWDENFGMTSAIIEEDSIDKISYSDDEIGNESSNMIISSSVESIEAIDVYEDLYEHNFDFGNSYYDVLEVDSDAGKISFDFSLTPKEELVVYNPIKVIFGNYSNEDYTYCPTIEVEPIFDNTIYTPGIDDIIDSSLVKAVALEKEVVVGEENATSKIVETEVTREKQIPEVRDDLVFRSKDVDSSIVVHNLKNVNDYVLDDSDSDSFVVNIKSQLDELNDYDMNLIEEFDFAEENYNYNFNSINILEEIADGMLIDDFVEEQDDEYFKYIYQFALLDDAIKTQTLDVNYGDVASSTRIVASLDPYLKELENKVQVEVVEEAPEEVVEEVAEEVVGKGFNVDSDLLNLTSKVIEHSSMPEVEEEEDKAYGGDSKSKFKALSPVFGGYNLDGEEVFEFEDEHDEFLAEEDDIVVEDLERLDSLINEVEKSDEIDSPELFAFEEVAQEEDHDVDTFIDMINDKIDNDGEQEAEEEFLDILKTLIKE